MGFVCLKIKWELILGKAGLADMKVIVGKAGLADIEVMVGAESIV